MKKYIAFLVATVMTTAFVVVKQSVMTALPGINKQVKACQSEKAAAIEPLQPGKLEYNRVSDSTTTFLFIGKFANKSNKKKQQLQATFFNCLYDSINGLECKEVRSCNR